MNIEIMRNTLYKAYLDDFATFCNKLGGTTAEVMGSLLAFEVRRLACVHTWLEAQGFLFQDKFSILRVHKMTPVLSDVHLLAGTSFVHSPCCPTLGLPKHHCSRRCMHRVSCDMSHVFTVPCLAWTG